ncbi:Multidrug resistance protein NorM [Pontiella sulfatireligans]|uniref:Multidrug-efflux transporter n=2 Tax=Pontiella sulfatireligans TaxID=2750658 RepID=A0A6C2UQJ8_9BACT|nr:Multidrug resistance protein NorM [Pontiella sulfatireligans]
MPPPETEPRPFGGWKELMKVAWPLIINSGTFAVLNFCDRLFLSWYSEDAFRASLPAGILFFTLVCGFMALAGFTNTFVSQMWGAGDKQGCAKATAQGIIFSLLSIPLIMALTPIGLWSLRISGHGPEVLALEEEYFKILMWCGGGMALSSALSSFFSGRGKTFVIMACNIIANGLNVVLNYCLVFGKWGFPEMGIAGAGWATVIGSWISPLIFALLYFSKSINAEFQTFKNLRYDAWLFKRMIRFGLPSGLHWFLDVAAFTVFVLLVGRLGPIAHIASNIALSINLIAFMPMIGMGMAVSILVGQYLGRNQPGDAERVGWVALKLGIGYIIFIGITFLFFPGFYTNVFEGNAPASVPFDELLKAVRILLMMLAVWGIADATGIILSGALKGAGDTHFVMYFQSVVAWGFLVLGQLVIVLVFKAGMYVSWAWTLLYIIILGVGFMLRFRSGRWKSIDLLDRRATVSVEPGIPVEH